MQTTYCDPWNDQQSPAPEGINDAKYAEMIKTALGKCGTARAPFIQQRYAFQAIKMMHFLIADRGSQLKPQYDSVIVSVYERYLKDKPTVVTDWALINYAYALPDKQQSLLMFLKVFERSGNKTLTAYENITSFNLDSLAGVIADTKTRATIRAVKAIGNPGRGLEDMKILYSLDPHSVYFDLLIGREVNKLENWILSPGVKNFTPAMREEVLEPDAHGDTTYAYFIARNVEKDKKYLEEYKRFLAGMLHSGCNNSEFVKLAIVRLCHVAQNFDEAATYLGTIPKLDDSLMEVQRETEQIVSMLYREDITSADVKAKLYGKLTSLDAKLKAAETTDYYRGQTLTDSKELINSLQLLISQRYSRLGDIVTAGLMFKKANVLVNDYYGGGWMDSTSYYGKIDYFDKFASPEDIDRLLQFIDKKDKSSFERYIAPPARTDREVYYDLKATLLIRLGKYEEALTVFDKMSDNFWEAYSEFEGYLRKTSVTSVGTLLPVKNGLDNNYAVASKRAILSDVVTLRHTLDTAKQKSVIARTSFLLANSYFNMSYWGKDWMMFSYGWSVNELFRLYNNDDRWAWYSFSPNDRRFGKVYYGCSRAKDMYQNALRHAGTDKELAAQAVLMLALCDKMGYNYLAELPGGDNASDQEGNKSPYLYLLKKYAQTNTFRRSVTECPDITLMY